MQSNKNIDPFDVQQDPFDEPEDKDFAKKRRELFVNIDPQTYITVKQMLDKRFSIPLSSNTKTNDHSTQTNLAIEQNTDNLPPVPAFKFVKTKTNFTYNFSTKRYENFDIDRDRRGTCTFRATLKARSDSINQHFEKGYQVVDSHTICLSVNDTVTLMKHYPAWVVSDNPVKLDAVKTYKQWNGWPEEMVVGYMTTLIFKLDTATQEYGTEAPFARVVAYNDLFTKFDVNFTFKDGLLKFPLKMYQTEFAKHKKNPHFLEPLFL